MQDADREATDKQLVRELHSFIPTAGYLELLPLDDYQRQSLLTLLASFKEGMGK